MSVIFKDSTKKLIVELKASQSSFPASLLALQSAQGCDILTTLLSNDPLVYCLAAVALFRDKVFHLGFAAQVVVSV